MYPDVVIPDCSPRYAVVVEASVNVIFDKMLFFTLLFARSQLKEECFAIEEMRRRKGG
jgi:hypothetical protein